MGNEETPVTSSDESDIETNCKDHLVAKFWSTDDDFDMEAAAASLTDDDRKAMAAKGCPPELVAQICVQSKQDTHVPVSEQSTNRKMEANTSTRFASGPLKSENSHGFGELLQRLRHWEEVELVSWRRDYRKKKVIGRGGQGTVYLTECLNEHNLPKALKVFSPVPYGDVQSYEEDMNRMEQVATLVSRIQIDNLVIIEQFTGLEGIRVLIMRWIDGYDLASLMNPRLMKKFHDSMDKKHWKHLINVVKKPSGRKQRALMPGIAVNVIEKILRALDALHSHRIVHGDIKPSNIMLDRYGSIRLVDLGSAFELAAPPRQHTWTPLYAPPEIFKGKDWTPQSDLASLGYVLIELLSGQPAVTRPNIGSESTRETGADWDQQLLAEKLQLPDRLDELLPTNVRDSEDLMNTLRRLIDPEPSKRFQNAEEAMIGTSGTYQFMQGLARMRLSAPFSQKLKLWAEDVKTLQQKETSLQ